MSTDMVVDPALAQAASNIQQRIKELNDLADEDLKGAMDDLKRALMENPAACSLMLPEDIGQMVSALRKITGQAVVAASKPKKEKKDKIKTLTAEQIAELEDF